MHRVSGSRVYFCLDRFVFPAPVLGTQKMFRIMRIPASRLQRNYKTSSSRLYRTLRYYSKEHKQNELCPPPPPSKPKTGTALTIGALALIGGAVIGYAKYDPDFRCWLTETVPGTDSVIKFLFQEEKSYYQSISDALSRTKTTLVSETTTVVSKKRKQIDETVKEYTPPTPVFPGVTKDAKEPEQKYDEIRLETIKKGEEEPVVEIVDPKPQESGLSETDPKSLAELEILINQTATETIQAYHKAVIALKHYHNEVEVIVEESVDRLNPSIWESLKEKTIAKEEAIQKAEAEAASALDNLHKLKGNLAKLDESVSEGTKEQAKRNLAKVTDDINVAKHELEHEKKVAGITEKYWKKVEAARRLFSEELEILFPNINIAEKKVHISEGDLDLFVLHAMSKVLYYQKELHKLETIGNQRLQTALDAARRGGFEVLTTEQICAQLEKEKRQLVEDFQKKCLKLREDSERDLRNQLKLQSQAFSDHLADAVKLREAEIERDLTRTFDEQLTEERCNYKLQVAGMIGRLRGLDQAIRARAETDKSAQNAQILWSACQALIKSIKVGCPGLPWVDQLRPLDPEINAVKKAASNNDELVKVVTEAIPQVAQNRGVYPEDALRERFLKVEKLARRVSLVPEEGAGLHMFFLSYLQSLLLLKAPNPIPQAELNDEVTDFSKLSTNEILQRARYWLDRGDFSQTLRYMNLLKGAPRVIARQWMEETKILLETEQAANTLIAHASASGLLYL